MAPPVQTLSYAYFNPRRISRPLRWLIRVCFVLVVATIHAVSAIFFACVAFFDFASRSTNAYSNGPSEIALRVLMMPVALFPDSITDPLANLFDNVGPFGIGRLVGPICINSLFVAVALVVCLELLGRYIGRRRAARRNRADLHSLPRLSELDPIAAEAVGGADDEGDSTL